MIAALQYKILLLPTTTAESQNSRNCSWRSNVTRLPSSSTSDTHYHLSVTTSLRRVHHALETSRRSSQHARSYRYRCTSNSSATTQFLAGARRRRSGGGDRCRTSAFRRNGCARCRTTGACKQGISSRRPRPALLPDRENLVGGGRTMLLTKAQDGVSARAGAARPRLRRLAGATTPTMDRRAVL